MWALCIVDRTIIRNIWKLRMGLTFAQSEEANSLAGRTL